MVLNSSPSHCRGNNSNSSPSHHHANGGLEPEVVVVTNAEGRSPPSGSQEQKLREGCRVTAEELLSFASQIASGMVSIAHRKLSVLVANPL